MLDSNNKLAEELAKSLSASTSLMKDLLGDIKDNATSLALVKAKLESLSSSVDVLSKIVRSDGGKGSVVTRLALAEKTVDDMKEYFNKFNDEVNSAIKDIKKSIEEERKEDEEKEDTGKAFIREQTLSKLKIAAVVAPGIIALVILIIRMAMGEGPTQ